jgi:hypothetical protein
LSMLLAGAVGAASVCVPATFIRPVRFSPVPSPATI